MTTLRVCAACGRHVEVAEKECPFCGHAQMPGVVPMPPPEVLFGPRAGAHELPEAPMLFLAYGAPPIPDAPAPAPSRPHRMLLVIAVAVIALAAVSVVLALR